MPTAVGLDAIADHPDLIAIAERCEIHEVTKEDAPDRWLELRRGGLGGSDTGSVLGVSPYRSPLKLWLQKTGQIPDDDLSDKESVYWGEVLEDVVAQEFAKRTGYLVIDPKATFINRAHPELIANPDRFYIDPATDRLGVLECKTGDWRTSEHWDDDASPPWYEAQTGHYLGVLGLTDARIACLLGGNNYQPRDPAFTAEFVEKLSAIELAWWERHVVGGEAPAIDGMAETTKALNAMWEVVAGQKAIDDLTLELEVDGEPTDVPIADILREFLQVRADLKAAEDRKKLLGNRLRFVLGDAEYATLNGVPVYSNKVIPTHKVDWEAVAIEAAAAAGQDVGAFVGSRHRTHGSYRRLNPLTNKKATAALEGA